MRHFLCTFVVATSLVLFSFSANAAWSISDMRMDCEPNSLLLYSKFDAGANLFMLPKGQTRELILQDLDSVCPIFNGPDFLIEVALKFPDLRALPHDVYKRNRLKLEVIDLATGLPLQQVLAAEGGVSCGGQGTNFYYSGAAINRLRAIKVRITNGGSKDLNAYLHTVHSSQTYLGGLCGSSRL